MLACLRLLSVMLLLVTMPTLMARAQPADQDALRLVRTTSSPLPAAAPAAAPISAPVAGGLATYLPLLNTAPDVRLEFSTAETDACEPFTPATNFTYGIKYLCYRITIVGGKNQKYRTEWSIDGKAQTGLNESGTVFASPELEGGVICYGPGGLSCGSALPRGNWQVKVFLNEQLYQQVTAVIS